MQQYEVGQNAIDVSDLYKRFTEGKIGLAYKRLMKSEDVQKYYTENLVVWAKELCSMISDEKNREIFEQVISTDMLQFNFQIQLVSMVFSEALSMWMNGHEDLTGNIIHLLDMDAVKNAVEFVQQILVTVINDNEGNTDSGVAVVNIQEFPVNVNNDEKGDIPDFRVMKNNGNNKLS